jgi:hypothetical protein
MMNSGSPSKPLKVVRVTDRAEIFFQYVKDMRLIPIYVYFSDTWVTAIRRRSAGTETALLGQCSTTTKTS